MNYFKSKLLTYLFKERLFKEWLQQENDVELLSLTKQIIDDRIITVDPSRKQIIGFRQN